VLDCEMINGMALHVDEMPGPDGAPPIVLINSLGCDLRIWHGVAPRLARQLTVLRYDKRGHGLSDIGKPPYTIEMHAKDLAALIEARCGGPAIICGLSIGGLIAIALTLARPDLVRALVLCDTAARISSSERYQQRIDRVHGAGMETIAAEQMERWFSDRFLREESGSVAIMRNMLSRQPVDGYLGSVAAIRDADYTDRIGAICAPTLCLVGTEDRSTPPSGLRLLADSIPGATYKEINGAAHLPCLEESESMARTLLDFCTHAD